MGKGKEVELFLLRKRTKSNESRADLKGLQKTNKSRRINTQKKKGKSFKRELLFIEKMVGVTPEGKRKKQIVKKHMRTLSINLPNTFSIIDQPNECLNKLLEFKAIFENLLINEIKISHVNTKKADLAAEILLAKVARTCMEKHVESRSAKRKKFSIGGDYPESESISRIIRSIGIVKELEIKESSIDERDDKDKKILIFKRRSDSGEQSSIGSLDHKTRTTQDFVTHINNCLLQSGNTLTDAAQQVLCEYIGEIITNAQDHSGTKHWEIFGYLDRENDERVCEVVIFNFGKTISETFMKLPHNAFARQSLNKYLQVHRQGGALISRWSQDLLAAVFSLQGSVSSKNIKTDITRGHGTVALIEFFQNIVEQNENKNAKMCILSGNEHIKFDGKYRLVENEGKPIIAFNSKNDLKVAPDRNYVKSLTGVSFPGTLIAIQFVLPESATQEIGL